VGFNLRRNADHELRRNADHELRRGADRKPVWRSSMEPELPAPPPSLTPTGLQGGSS
jgi:hypothetical protein